MIADDFIYCKPDTLREASAAYRALLRKDKTPFYYGGGSEIITMARAGSRIPDAVIDLKGIPECNTLKIDDTELVIGAAVTLNQIKESKLFPLLGITGSRIADHTNQCRITLGGNICGTIIYKETLLPLLLADSTILTMGLRGRRRKLHVSKLFDRQVKLLKGEFIYQIRTDISLTKAAFTHVKKTANEKIDYPLLTVCTLEREGKLRLAFSGMYSHPLRSLIIEDIINDPDMTIEEKLAAAIKSLPDFPLTDSEGSGEYLKFVLRNTLKEILERHEHDQIL